MCYICLILRFSAAHSLNESKDNGAPCKRKCSPFVMMMMMMIVFVNNIAKNYGHFKLLFDLDSVLSEITSHEVIPLC